MTEDKRGVLRGECCVDDCDCTLYERDDDRGMGCSYCSHSPAQHLKMKLVDLEEMPRTKEGDMDVVLLDERSIVITNDIKAISDLNERESELDESNASSTYSVAPSKSPPSLNSDPLCVPESKRSGSSGNHEPPVKKARFSGKGSKSLSSSQQPTASKEDIVACLPNILPPVLSNALDPTLEHVPFTNNLRSMLVRDIASRLNAKGIRKKAEVEVAADEAVKRWGSPLKCQFGKENAALTASILERLNKINRPSYGAGQSAKGKVPKSSSGTDTKDEKINHDEAAASIIEEMRKPHPSLPVLKSLLATTRKLRRALVERTPTSVTKVLKLYPALKITELLLAEFESIIGKPLAELEEMWNALAKKLIIYCNSERTCPTIDTTLPEECQHVAVLANLHVIVKGGKKSTQRKRRVLELFEEGTLIDSTVPDEEDPPRLVAVGNAASPTLSITCYADGQPLAVSVKPARAVMLLLAAYWVFDIDFATDARAPLLLLSAGCLGDKAPSHVVKYTAVVNLLNKLRLLTN